MEPNQNCSKENSRSTIEPDEPIKHAKTTEDSSDSATSTTTIISSPEGSSSDQPKIHSSSSSSTPTQLPTTPPIPAASNLKKFKASSLSVNKKFLSQSAVSDGKLSKNLHSASPRLTSLSSSSSPGTPGTAPRLLTGKIGLNNSILNSTGSAGSGWAKTSLVTSSPLSLTTSKSPELSHPNPPNLKYSHSSESLKNSRGVEDGHPSSTTAINAFLNTHSAQPYPNTTNSVHSNNKSHIPPSSSAITTASTTTSTSGATASTSSSTIAHPSSSSSSPWVKLGNSTNGGINSLATDFPTAQEVAQHTKLKAQSIAAAVAARDKVVQDRAAASAAYNQQLLQTLDGFRGTHLDPNASHWDEMEDEDDMFGEVVEFGDGTQYKVTEVVPPATDPGTSSGNETLPQSGISQGLNLKDRLSEDPRRSHHQPTSEEIDSMPPFLRGRAELKSLYNERIGKFEPYSGKPNEKPRDHHPHVQLLQRQRDGPNDPSSSTPHSARSPHSTGPDGKPTDHNPTQHHRHQTHQPDHHNLIPPSRTSLSQPLSPPSASHTSAPSTASAPIKVADDTPEAADKQPTAPDDSNSALKYRKPDLDQVHRSEMTSAAERARKRRQEEEATRESEKERAKLKATEIEAKLKAAADAAKAAADAAKAAADAAKIVADAAKAAEKAAALEAKARNNSKSDSSPKPFTRPSSNDPSRNPNPSRSDLKDSWRRPPPHHSEDKPKSVITSPKLASNDTTVAKPVTAPRPLASVPAENPATLEEPSANGARRPSDQTHNVAPLPPQDEAFKRRSEDVSSRPSVWKPKIASVSSSQGRAEDRQSQQTTPTDRASKPISIQKRPVPSAPAADQRWRPSQDNAPKPASRSDTRQLPPHIQPDLVKTSDPTSPAPRAASPQPETRPVPKSSADSRSSPPASLPTYASPNMSANTPHFLAADKKAGFKLPEMSHLDTVMSRIKGVLDADKEARVKAAVVVTTFKESPQAPSATPPSSSKPKDSLKTTPIRPGSDNQLKEIDTGASSPQGQTTSSSTAVYIAGRPRTLLPRTIETTTTLNASSGSKTPSGSALPASGSSTPAAPPKIPITPILTPALSNPAMKKPSSVRKAARFDIPTTVESKPTAVSTSTSFPSSAPKCVNRDPIVFFDATRQERPSSPGPAWKAFTVKFGAGPPKPQLASHVIKSFWNPLTPTKVNILTWDPPMLNLSPRSLSRDELLFRKKYVRGILVSQVQFPKNSVSDLDFTKAPSAPKASSSEPLTRDDGSMRGTRGRGAAPVGSRGRGRGRADETTSWRRPVEEEKTPSVTATPVPDSITTPPVDSTLSITTAPIEPPKSSESPTTRRTKVKIPDGLKVAFHKPAHILSSTSSSGMFMVHSEINGEGSHSSQDLVAASSGKPKPSSPTRSPTQDTTPMPLTPPVATPPRSSSIACMSGSKGSTSPWTKSPLAFSVLDSHTKNVWSQPDGQITGQPPPSGKTENSLEGITDDFPASLPRTLNDFNAVEEPSSSTRHPAAQFSSSSSSRKSTELPGPNKREQNGESPNTLHLGSNNNSDEPPKTNGLVQHPYMNPPGGPAHYNNESPSLNSGHIYGPHGYSSPNNFQVPPGYQLVPIGSLQNSQATPQYPSISGIYPGQQPTAPWSPSPGPGQPNGYARSPQLYSPNTSFSSPVTSASYPSHPHSVGPSPISDGPGFNKSPGPIAPRGSRSSVPTSTSHPNRQQQPNELVNLPSNSNTSNNNNNLRRNQPNYSPHPPSSTSKAQNSNTGHSYQVSVGSLDLTSQHPPNNNLPPGGGNGVGPGGVYPDSAGFGPFHHSQTGLLHHQQSLPIPTSFNNGVHLGGGTGPQSSHLVGPHNLHHSHLPHPHSHHAQQQQQSNLGAGAHPSPQGHYISHPPPFHPVLHQQQQQHRIVPGLNSMLGPAPLPGSHPGLIRGPDSSEHNHHNLSHPSHQQHPSISNYPTNHHPHQQHQHHIPPHNHHHQLINNHHHQQQQQQTLNGNINLSNNTHRPFIGHNHHQQQQQPPPPAPAPSSAASSSPTITTSSPTTTTTKTTHPSRNNNHSASSNNHSVLGNGIPIGNSVVHTPKGNLNHGPVGFGPRR
ncbi:hypothetical protein MJO29_005942 [Puccinia striiformis f. sp. tritici]|nr:hypothetical protein MJO29_005942 [Puccinia striiformis f. sp. tritici]